jgi:hypothetical protein
MQFAASMTKHLTSIVLLVALSSACDPEPEQVRGSGYSSECGGFGQGGGFFTPAAASSLVAPAYCDASMLYWTHDVDTATLHVRHTRTEMNCGAIPGVDLRLDDGVFQIVEKEILDGPPYGCLCVFDFDVRLEDVPPDQVALEIWQRDHAERAGKGTRLWSGTLDVSQGAGELVLDGSASSWCDENSPY